MSTIEDLRATLTGPGGAFEVVTESVNGIEMLVYKDRMQALREVIAHGRPARRRADLPRLRRP